MKHLVSLVIAKLIQQEGLGADPEAQQAFGDWPVFAEASPDEPDNWITVRKTVGRNDGRLLGEGTLISHPGIQITVRSRRPEVGWTKANEIQQFIDTVGGWNSDRTAKISRNVLIGTYSYDIKNISGGTEPIPAGMDERQRSLYTINRVCTIQWTDTTNPVPVTYNLASLGYSGRGRIGYGGRGRMRFRTKTI